MVTKRKLNNLKILFKDRELKRKLINRSECSRANVNYVLDGRHKNKTVIDMAYLIIQEEKQNQTKSNVK